MKKDLNKTLEDSKIWAEIETGIFLTTKFHPQIKDIMLTPQQKGVLINFYSQKKYVDYCAKFEEYFQINTIVTDGRKHETSVRRIAEGTGNQE